jgi:hypothetical protein
MVHFFLCGHLGRCRLSGKPRRRHTPFVLAERITALRRGHGLVASWNLVGVGNLAGGLLVVGLSTTSGIGIPIFGYDAIDDAVAAANATEFGLTASVWTGDDALADKVTGQLIAGTVSVNCHGMAAQDPRVPFGGVGQSGLGRELGADGIRAFTQPRGYVRQPAPQ